MKYGQELLYKLSFHFTKHTRWSQAVGSTNKLCITMDREQRFKSCRMGGSICNTATKITRERTAWKKRQLGCEEMTNVKLHKGGKRKQENKYGESH